MVAEITLLLKLADIILLLESPPLRRNGFAESQSNKYETGGFLAAVISFSRKTFLIVMVSIATLP